VTTHFSTKQIKGKGRGKFLGYPTINMEVPVGFELVDGIYAVWVTLEGMRFRGALHWGPIPTFDDGAKSLEVYLLGVDDGALDRTVISVLSVEIVKKLRDIKKFASVNELTKQIGRDVQDVRGILHE
jgi:riboflavin kinase / FMN adenylyltransferase